MAKQVRVDWGLIGHLVFSVFVFLCVASCGAGLIEWYLQKWFPSLSDVAAMFIHGILVTGVFAFLLYRAVQRYRERKNKPPSAE